MCSQYMLDVNNLRCFIKCICLNIDIYFKSTLCLKHIKQLYKYKECNKSESCKIRVKFQKSFTKIIKKRIYLITNKSKNTRECILKLKHVSVLPKITFII